MPGIAWSLPAPSSSLLCSSTQDANSEPTVATTQATSRTYRSFTRTTSASSLDSVSFQRSEEGSTLRKDALREACAALSRTIQLPSLVWPYNASDSQTSSGLADEQGTLPSTPTLLSPRSSVFSSSLDSNSSSQKGYGSTMPFGMPRSPLKLNRRHHCRRCGSCFCSEHSSNACTLILASEDAVAYETARNRCKTTNKLNTIDELCQGSMLDNALEDADLNSTAPCSPSRRLIRARVCDGCYFLCQKAKDRLEDVLRDSSASSTTSPPSLLEESITPNGMVLGSLSTSMMTLGSGWSTPTIVEQDEEYFQSKERINMESRREQKEAIKFLCNDPTANRVVAKAAGAAVGSNRTPNVGSGDGIQTMCSSSLLDCGRYVGTSTKSELTMGCQLATASIWEKVERKRRNEEVARRAMSYDSLLQKTNSKPSCFLQLGAEDGSSEEDEEWNVQLDAVVSLSKTSIFDRRCSSRPPSPQPIIRKQTGFGRRGSEGTSALTSLPTLPMQQLGGMGAKRLQRSFDSNQRSSTTAIRPRRSIRPAT